MIKVEREKCIRCGACAEVCIMGTIKMTSEGPAETNTPCIRCGHCMAVCPTGALVHDKCRPLLDIRTNDVDAEGARQVLLSRTSCRNYLDKPVEREKILTVLNVARQALSARNVQGISYVVVEDRSKLSAMTRSVISKYESDLAQTPQPLREAMVKRYKMEGVDTILWHCPALIMAKSDVPCGKLQRESAIFCLTYAHIFARYLGLACCWAGAFENTVFAGWPEAVKTLDMFPPEQFCAALMIGYPRYTMHRIPERDPLRVEWV